MANKIGLTAANRNIARAKKAQNEALGNPNRRADTKRVWRLRLQKHTRATADLRNATNEREMLKSGDKKAVAKALDSNIARAKKAQNEALEPHRRGGVGSSPVRELVDTRKQWRARLQKHARAKADLRNATNEREKFRKSGGKAAVGGGASGGGGGGKQPRVPAGSPKGGEWTNK